MAGVGAAGIGTRSSPSVDRLVEGVGRGTEHGARAVGLRNQQGAEDDLDPSAGASEPLVRPRVLLDPSLGEHPLRGELGLASPQSPAPDAFLIGEVDGALDLRPPGEHDRRGVQAIFPPDRGSSGRGARAATGLRQSPLLRAFGKQIERIFDLTAGLGADAYRLASAGHHVLACERDPAIHAVLVSGWKRARERGLVPDELADRLQLVRGDGATWLDSLAGLDLGVYIDPMYPPPRRRSAKPRRELQVLRALLGPQQDAAELVARARERAARVVVKRPHHAQPLVPGPSFETRTKLVRFDVYVNPARMRSRSDE